jgi:CHAD domain-containing protein
MSGLRRSQSGTRGVRRVVRTQIGAALEALGERGLSSDETIHDTRKRLKRVRAGLRLLREAMGEGRYRRENALIRDAARPLTELRDAKVLLDALRSGDRSRAPRVDRSTDRSRSRCRPRRAGEVSAEWSNSMREVRILGKKKGVRTATGTQVPWRSRSREG